MPLVLHQHPMQKIVTNELRPAGRDDPEIVLERARGSTAGVR